MLLAQLQQEQRANYQHLEEQKITDQDYYLMKKDQIVDNYQGNEIIYEVNETEAMEQTEQSFSKICSNSNIINRSSVQRPNNNFVRASNVSDIDKTGGANSPLLKLVDLKSDLDR